MPVKSKVRISQNFVAVSEYMNFKKSVPDSFNSTIVLGPKIHAIRRPPVYILSFYRKCTILRSYSGHQKQDCCLNWPQNDASWHHIVHLKNFLTASLGLGGPRNMCFMSLEYGFYKKLRLFEWNSGQLNTFLSKLDSPEIKTLERHSLKLKKCLSNVLITEESIFDEKKVFSCPVFHS